MGVAPLRLEGIGVMAAAVVEVVDAEVELDVEFVVAVILAFDAEFCVAELPPSPLLAVCEG